MNIGKIRGAIVSRMPTINVPLMMLPNRRMARAKVRENSLIMLNGSMMNVGFRRDWAKPPNPCSSMAKSDTATNTEIASADVVESEPVGGSYQGRIAQRFDTAINRNKVPIKPRYFSG